MDLLRIEDVADLTGVTENTLRFWRANGIGPKSAKLGRRIVYREADVRAWVDAQFGEAPASPRGATSTTTTNCPHCGGHIEVVLSAAT